MRLVDLVQQETGEDFEQILLLRHSNEVDIFKELGGSIEEFTAFQPTDTKWDFWRDGKPRIDVVVAIFHDCVEGVYRVLGVEAEGTLESLAGDILRHFNELRKHHRDPNLSCRRFRIERIPSKCDKVPVTGWEGKGISSPLRSDGNLFWEIKVKLPDGELSLPHHELDQEQGHDDGLYSPPMASTVPSEYAGPVLPDSIISLLSELDRYSFSLDVTGQGNKTIRIRRNDEEFGYINSTVIRRGGILGYHFAKHGRAADACPAEIEGRLVDYFCKFYHCPSSAVDVHAGSGSNRDRTYLIFRDPQVALRVLLHDCGIEGSTRDSGIRLPDHEAVPEGWDDDESYTPQQGDWRKTVERQIRERRGQQQFRDALRDRYGDRCMVTGCNVLDVLEAAHIKPYRGEDDNHPENGLLLRSDIHTLFDLDLLGIDPDRLRIEMHSKLAKNKEYGKLAGKPLKCARDRRPSQEALRIRYDQFQQRLRELL